MRVEHEHIILPQDNGISIKLTFEPRDLWVGAYWDFQPYTYNPDQTEHWVFDLYVCVIPCLPLHLRWAR